MKDVRQGNDTSVIWGILSEDAPVNLQNYDLSLYLTNKFGKKKITDFKVKDNNVYWTFYGKEQTNTGVHGLVLVLNEGKEDMHTVDKCNLVNIVSCSCKITDGADSDGVQTEVIEFTSTIEFAKGAIEVDSELSETSENPVQNKVVTAALNEHTAKLDTIEEGAQKNDLRYFGPVLEGDPREEIVWDRTSNTATIEAQEIGMTHLVYPTFTRGYQVFYNVISKNDLLSKGVISIDAGRGGANGSVNASVKEGVITLTLKGTASIYDYPWYAVVLANGVVPIPEAFIPNEVVREKTLEQYVSSLDLGDFEADVVDVKLSKKQDKLESGKTIKTINGESLLGKGNIVISGGTGGSYDDTEIKRQLTELSEKVDELGQPIFKAVYGETKVEEIIAAYESGKVVHCDFNGLCYTLTRINNGDAFFTTDIGVITYRLHCAANGIWTPQTYVLEQASNKTTTLSSASTDTQYPSAKAVYEAIAGVKEKDYELLLDVTMDTDVDTFSVIDRVPNILSYKDYIILIEFKYQEGVTRTKGYLSFNAVASHINGIVLEKVVKESYLTHYILRVHRGRGYDRTAYLESHTNAFENAAYDDVHKGLNLFTTDGKDGANIDTCIFNFKFYAGEKIKIYGK